MSVLRRYSTGEWLFITMIVISLIPIIEITFDIQLVAITFSLTLYYLCILFFSRKNKGYLEKHTLFFALFFWTLFILIRGFKLDYSYIRNLFILPYIFLPYTFPFIVKCFSILDIKRIYSLIHISNIIYLSIVAIHIFIMGNDIDGSVSFVETSSHYLAFPNFLLLLSISKISNKKKIVSVISFFVGFYLSILCGRRGLVWMFACAGVLSFVIMYTETKKSIVKKFAFFVFLTVIILLFYYFYISYEQQIFGTLLNRIDADTRGGVLYDFDKDMGFFDLIFGRGIGGEFAVQFMEVDGDTNTRSLVEAGYLTIILYGGYIYLMLLLLIYFKAIYNGFVKSKNLIGRVFAAFILLHILELYPAGILFFNVRFLLIWISVAMCYNRKFLNYTEGEFFDKKYL